MLRALWWRWWSLSWTGRLATAAVLFLVAARGLVPLAYAVRPYLEAGAVLAVALIGFGLIVTAPFRRG